MGAGQRPDAGQCGEDVREEDGVVGAVAVDQRPVDAPQGEQVHSAHVDQRVPVHLVADYVRPASVLVLAVCHGRLLKSLFIFSFTVVVRRCLKVVLHTVTLIALIHDDDDVGVGLL